jgi:ketosteroid isomerase-like protein
MVEQSSSAAVAARLRRAYESRDLDSFSALLAEDVRWGDDAHPHRCRNRRDVLRTYRRVMGEGVDAEITEMREGAGGILCGLRVRWDDATVDPTMYHVYLLRGDRIAEIRRYDDRPHAARAVGLS